MSCPCDKDKKKPMVVHKKGVYVSPPKVKCGDCKKSKTNVYSTKNIRSRKFK